MTTKDLANIVLTKQGKSYHFINSPYYNWFKAMDLNLLNSDGFTNYFLRMKKNEPIIFEKLQDHLLTAAITAFKHELAESDTFVLLTATWANGFVPEKAADALQDLMHFLSNYTIQKDPLLGLNQMNADFNQALIQHLPKVRRQDLRLIERLLLLKNVNEATLQTELSKLNEPTRKRTEKIQQLFQSI